MSTLLVGLFVGVLAWGALPPAAHADPPAAADAAAAKTVAPGPSAQETEALLRRVLASRGNPGEHQELLAGLRRDCAGCFEPILEVFEGNAYDLADGAAEALGALGDQRAIDPLASELLNGRLPERKLIREAPTRVEGYHAADIAKIYLLRATAATALARIGGPRAIDGLVELFRKGDFLYDRKLLKEPLFDAASGRELPAQVPAFARKLFNHTARVLAAADPVEAIDAFTTTLSRQEKLVRTAALTGLARCANNPEARAVLLPALTSADAPEVAEEIAEVAGQEFSDAEVATVAMAFLDEKECVQRDVGLSILMVRTDPSGERPPYPVDSHLKDRLFESLASPCFNIAAMAATILHREHLTEPLQRALREGDLRFIAENFIYYVMLGGEESEKALVRTLEDYGTAAMYDIFMICGNPVLESAATEWISSSRNAKKENEFTRSTGIPISWGTFAESTQP